MTRDLHLNTSPDLSAISAGVSVYSREPREVVPLMRVMHGLVRRAIDERSVGCLMAFTYANLDVTLQRVAHVPIACKAGCAHCCHGFVAATAPEVLHLVKRFAPDRAGAVRAAVARAHALTAGKSAEERTHMTVPCALLENNLCTVYEDRPITCRTGISTRADICERAHIAISGEDIPRPVVYLTMRRAYYVAFAGALRRAGLVYKPYEYNGALNRALNDPGAEADWLAGRDIFEGLVPDRGGDPFEDPKAQAAYDAAFA